MTTVCEQAPLISAHQAVMACPPRSQDPPDDDPLAGNAPKSPVPPPQPPESGNSHNSLPSSESHEESLLPKTACVTFYGYRWYDPVTGRWPSRDPIGERGGINLHAFVENRAVNYIDKIGLQMYEGYSVGASLSQRRDLGSKSGKPDFVFENSQRIFHDRYNINDFFDNTNWYESRYANLLSEALKRATEDVQHQIEKFTCRGVGNNIPNNYPILGVVNQSRVIDSHYPTGNTVMDSTYGDKPASWIEATYTGIGSHSFLIEQSPIKTNKLFTVQTLCSNCDYYSWESNVLLRDKLGPDYNQISVTRGKWKINGLIICCTKKPKQLY